MTQSALQHHIQLLLDDEISTDEFAVLETELLENPGALETYRAYARLHCGLHRHCDIQQMIKSPQVVPIDRVLSLQRKFVIKASLLGAAATILLSAVIMLFLQTTDHQPSLARFQVAPGSDFTLSHSDESKSPVGDTMAEGSRLVVRHGVVELKFPHDVRAVIEAPAEMILRDDRTLEVSYGRALFQVKSEAGRGFTVVTPHQRIVDLGTAFGIDFQQGSDKIELHVLKGSVRIDTNEGDKGEIIKANRSVLLAGKKIQREIAPPSLGFLRQLPSKIDMLLNEEFDHGIPNGQNYIIRMDPTIISDLAGNNFQGIDDDTTWNFNSSPAFSTYATTILADNFSDVVKVDNTASLVAWDTVNGIDTPATSLAFFKGGTTTAAKFHNVTAGEIDVNNNMTAGGWDTSFLLDLKDSTALIKLSSIAVDLRLTSNTGNAQTSGKSSRVTVELVGNISGSLGKIEPGNRACPTGVYTSTLDLSSLPTLDGSETYTLHLKARGTGSGHHKSLKNFELKGFIATVSASSPALHAPIGVPILGDPSKTNSANDPTQATSDREDSPPVLIALHPADNSNKTDPGGQLKMLFNEPIKLNPGRMFIKNVTDGSESTLVFGSRQLSVDGRVMTINPPTVLKDGSRKLGWLAGWESNSPIIFLNPRGDGKCYSHEGLQDDSPTRGLIGSMRSHGMVGIRQGIRRGIGTITADSCYTVSTTIGVGASSAKAKNSFPGYTIRLSSGDTELAKLTSNTPPGPGNSVSTVGFSWDSSILPDGVHPGDPLAIEITPNQTSSPGYLYLNALRISVLDQSGR